MSAEASEQEQPCVAGVSDWACGVAATAALEALTDGHAVRILARAWIRILWRAWQDRVEYNPEKHAAAAHLAN